METNEIMTNNEEIIEEVTEEVVTKRSGKGFKIAAGVGLTILIGSLVTRYVVLPAVRKVKVKKKDEVIDVESKEIDDEDMVNDSGTDSEE